MNLIIFFRNGWSLHFNSGGNMSQIATGAAMKEFRRAKTAIACGMG